MILRCDLTLHGELERIVTRMDPEIQRIYGNRVRVRVSGLCWKDFDSLLLINHKNLTEGAFWAPPGGGVEFGQNGPEALRREFEEETGLTVKVGSLQFVCELVKPPLHAVELFFNVTIQDGELSMGLDPEMMPEKQIIQDIRFMTFEEVLAIPPGERHGIFSLVTSASELKSLNGYFKI